MPQPVIIRVKGSWGTFSWTDGVKLFEKENSLDEEAQKNPEAVINRLINQEKWDEAEDIMDRFINTLR